MTTIYDSSSSMGSLELYDLYANAWVNCGITGNINSSFNVSSITDVGTGGIGVSFSTPFASGDYVANVLIQKSIAIPQVSVPYQITANLSASRSDFEFVQAAVDPTVWHVRVIGNNGN